VLADQSPMSPDLRAGERLVHSPMMPTTAQT
jgi:hypothetical protein